MTADSIRRAGMPPLPVSRSVARLLVAVSMLSLVATADMAGSALTLSPFALLPPAIWVVLLLALAIVLAALGRRSRTSHLAIEPLTMAFMFVLAVLHGHGADIPPQDHSSHSFDHGTAWLGPALAAAVVVLSVTCTTISLRACVRSSRRSHPHVLLPLSSAVAMCAMTVWMLVP